MISIDPTSRNSLARQNSLAKEWCVGLQLSDPFSDDFNDED